MTAAALVAKIFVLNELSALVFSPPRQAFRCVESEVNLFLFSTNPEKYDPYLHIGAI
jgi:hypothetical protein